MSKLYQITSYHCPRCGGVAKPSQRFCEWCGRELSILIPNVSKKLVRVMVESDNGYIHLNDVLKIGEVAMMPETLDCTALGDISSTYIVRHRTVQPTWDIVFPASYRAQETIEKIKARQDMKVRIEAGEKYAWEMIADAPKSINKPDGKTTTLSLDVTEFVETTTLSLDVSEFIGLVPVIPEKIMNEGIRCKNCGAPLKSRIGACDYCGGWNEVEW